jgi:hypothetical protein
VLARVRHWPLSWTRWIKFTPPSPFIEKICSALFLYVLYFSCIYSSFLYCCDEMKLDSQQIYCSALGWYKSMKPRWNDTDRGNWRSRGETCSSDTLSTTDHTYAELRASPGLRGERPATNHLSHGVAIILRLLCLHLFIMFPEKKALN